MDRRRANARQIRSSIAPIPKPAELREVVPPTREAQAEVGFHLAPNIVMELQAQPCSLLSEQVKALARNRR
jgi:hypothetical protein